MAVRAHAQVSTAATGGLQVPPLYGLNEVHCALVHWAQPREVALHKPRAGPGPAKPIVDPFHLVGPWRYGFSRGGIIWYRLTEWAPAQRPKLRNWR